MVDSLLMVIFSKMVFCKVQCFGYPEFLKGGEKELAVSQASHSKIDK